MKKVVFAVSIVTMAVSSALAAEEIGTIEVESTKLSDVSGEEVKSADLAEALTRKVPSISLVRRSGIANDIILRGQKKDNINILIDNTKVYGACPKRMDPPTSHILTNTIDSIEVIEGPYDVENFGTLSGAVKVTTIKPSEGLNGEVSLNVGSFDYLKAAATVSGGNDDIRFTIEDSYGSVVLNMDRVQGRYDFLYTASTAGFHTMYFDNSFSLITDKQVFIHYRVR